MGYQEIVYEGRNDAWIGEMIFLSERHSGEQAAEIRPANIWGTEESLDGMTAFLEHRPADFHQFRIRNKAALDQYRSDFDQGRNQKEASQAARP